jgi:hypothetical protein
VGLDGQQSTLNLPELEALAGQNCAKEHGAVHVFEGALPGDVLAKVGASAGKAIRGVSLVDVVIVEARDGYKVAFDLAGCGHVHRSGDLSRSLGWGIFGRRQRAVSVVVEGDLRAVRSVRMVSAIRLERMR